MLRNQYYRLSQIYKDAVKHINGYVIETQIRNKFSWFFIFIIFSLTLYTFFLRAIDPVLPQLPGPSLLTIPLLGVIVIIAFIGIKVMDFSLEDYGFTLKNWRGVLLESLFFSGLFIVIGSVVDYLLFLHYHAGQAFRYVQVAPMLRYAEGLGISLSTYVVVQTIVYIIHSPLQEIVARGFLQSSLMQLLRLPYARWWAIVISNMIFSAYHLHISLLAFTGAFVAGLFWGWLYSRSYSLLGVTLSHILIGLWATFFLGII